MIPDTIRLNLVRMALDEDIGHGDITTELTIGSEVVLTARLRSRQDGVACGLGMARTTFETLDPTTELTLSLDDGDRVGVGDTMLIVSGKARPILMAERVALNFVQHMSGIATMTSRFVRAVSESEAIILDTRKTAPGLRVIDKYTVSCGGGRNHRFGLFDGILIKDNHIAAAGGIRQAVERARAGAPHGLKIEVEVDNLQDIEPAIDAGADIVLLDNMRPKELAAAVRLIAGRAQTEASGGVTLDTVGAIAASGIDFISVGELTHSVRALDVGLDFDS
jgi:nicotinate-nucleotide pyrophosphorylase (carboxylating)